MARSDCSGCRHSRARCRRTRTATNSQPANASSTSTSRSTIVNWTQAHQITRTATTFTTPLRLPALPTIIRTAAVGKIGRLEGPPLTIIKWLEMRAIIALVVGTTTAPAIIIITRRQEHLKMKMTTRKSKGSWPISKMAIRLSANIMCTTSSSSPTQRTTSPFSARQRWVAPSRPSGRTPRSPPPNSTTATTSRPQHAPSAEVQTGEVAAPTRASSNTKHIPSLKPKVTSVRLMT